MVISVETIRQMIRNAVGPLVRRARGMVRRAVLNSLTNDGGLALGQFELSQDEQVDAIEVINPPGLSFRPVPGAEALVIAVGGDPTNLVAIPWVRGQRLTGDDLEAGEVALHIGNAGQVVHLKLDKSIVVQSGTSGSTVTLTADGNIVLTPGPGGQILLGSDGAAHPIALGDVVDAQINYLKGLLNSHTHMGVTAGPGVTGVPSAPFTGFASVESDTIFGVS